MKRSALILICSIAALVSFSSCDKEGNLEGIDKSSFILVKDDPDKPVPVSEGQTMELKIGEFVLPAFYEGKDGWFGLQAEGKCIVGDPSILMFYRGCLYALQGGKSSVTLEYKGHEVHFNVNVPGATHGTIYFSAYDRDWDRPAEDWEGVIPYSELLVVNGVLTDKPCALLSSDSEGNLWQGVYRGRRVYISCNGRELGENASVEIPHPELHYLPKKEFIRTRRGKLFFFNRNQYKIISPDGTVTEGTVDGNILDMDINAQGDIYLWTWYYMTGHVCIVSPDGTITSHEAGTDHIIIGGTVDSEGNEYFMCKLDDNKVGVFKNGEHIYNLTDTYNPRLMAHGTDLWIACYSPDGEPNADGYVTDWGLYLVKNKEVNHIATGLWTPGEIDLCMTRSGVPYILSSDSSGSFVYKDSAPVLFIPFSNGENPQFAVID